MNGRLVMCDGRIWTVHQPATGGTVLRRRDGMRWISRRELAVLETAGLEDLREDRGRLKRREAVAA